jgi:prolyl oligopeptidase
VNKHFDYPEARKADVVEHYHGTPVHDPYRWLEDAGSPETAAWVDAQNALTRSILQGPARDRLVERLTALYDYPRTGVPFRRGDRYFFTHNTGLQDQPVLYVQEGIGGSRRPLLDPNLLNAADRSGGHGPVALTGLSVDDSGMRAAYALSTSGSDRQEIRIREIATGVDQADRLLWAKFVSLAWEKDGKGFYYTRFPVPGTVPAGEENYFNAVYHHRLGDPQERDTLIFDRPAERETVFNVEISHDDRWVVITAFQGSSDKSETWVVDRHAAGSLPAPLWTGFSSAYALIDGVDGRLFFRTDEGAPLGRIVSVDPSNRERPPDEIVPESPDKLSAALIVHGMLVTSYLRNASHRVLLFDLSGAPAGEIPLPALGSVTGISGRPEDDEMFIGFTSFVHPPATYRYEFTRKRLEPFAPEELRFRPADYETTQIAFVESYLAANPDTTSVTINIGANDLLLLQRSCLGDAACRGAA